ncbi:hypothetical protein [Enterococcus sp. DIV0876]|uniref:helix-turn-helix domain-containing protein n=1 Tax=Enterococcus sp. DIV0876 TaxID=2774633 RepID=UPI003D300ACD
MKDNQLLKKLRIERGVSQQNLTQNISNRNTLSSYETDGTSMKFHLLHQYLNKLNVSFDEFILSSQDTVSTKQKIATQLETLYYKQDFELLGKQIKELEQLYDTTNDFFYFHLIGQYKLALDKLDILLLSYAEKKLLKNTFQSYLNKIETWGRFESTIFINVMHLFETDYIILNLNSIEKKINTYRLIFQKNRLIEKMYINSLILFAERNEIEFMRKILDAFIHFVSSDDLRSKVLILFFEGLITNDKDKTTEALNLLKRFEMTFHYHFLSNLLKAKASSEY